MRRPIRAAILLAGLLAACASPVSNDFAVTVSDACGIDAPAADADAILDAGTDTPRDAAAVEDAIPAPEAVQTE